MTDFTLQAHILRGQMADILASDPEHIAFVIAEVMSRIIIEDVIDFGELGDDAHLEKPRVIANLRALADAIESGALS